MASAALVAPHGALSVNISDNLVVIQPRSAPGAAQQPVDTLTINLDRGKVEVQQLEAVQAPPAAQQQHVDALAVLGLCRLHAGEAGAHRCTQRSINAPAALQSTTGPGERRPLAAVRGGDGSAQATRSSWPPPPVPWPRWARGVST